MAFAQPSAPGSGDNFTPADHNGHLLIVYPKSYTDGAKTKHGESSAADVDIIIVDKYDQAGKPVAFINARIFGNLARSVRNDIGGQVLGRLGQGPNTQGSPPWILTAFTDADAAAADPVDAAYQQGHFRPAPNPMAQTPAPAAYTPPAAPAPAPQQQWNAAPAPGAAAPAAPTQQWQPGAVPPQAQTAPAVPAQWAPQAQPAPVSPPTAAPQWQPQPTAAPTPPPAPAAAAPAAIDPNLVAFLAARGINLPPGTSQADAEAVAASVQ